MRFLLFTSMTLAIGMLGCQSDSGSDELEAGTDADTDADADPGSDADADSDVDADADADTDADSDADAGYTACELEPGSAECDSDEDCGKLENACICPMVLGNEEITSYCYPSCTNDTPCEEPWNACILISPDAGVGACLASGYWETYWKGKYIPDIPYQDGDDITYTNVEFSVGAVNIAFMISLVMEVNDTDLGHLVAIAHVSQTATDMWQLNVYLPFDRFVQDSTIDFSSCEDDAGPCSATLVQGSISGTTITQAFVRAINVVDPNASYENWVAIQTASYQRGFMCIGDLKLFFAEYSAEIPSGK